MKTVTSFQKNSGAASSADTTRPNCHGRNTWLAALSLALLSVLASPSAFGAAYYWDSDADATIGSPAASTAGSGTWNAANTNWNLAGTAGSDVAWVSGSDAVFAGSDGTYAITLGSNLNIGNLTFSNSGYTVSAASALSLSNTVGNNTVTVAAGKTATIGNNVTFTNGFNNAVISLTGDAAPGGSVGTLIIDNGGKVQTTFGSPIIYVGSTSNTAGTLRATTVQVNTGGAISSLGSVVVNGLLRVNGGNVTASTGIIAIGNFADTNMPASAILTIDSGDVTSTGGAGVRFGSSTTGGTTNTGGTLNLNGGTLTTAKIYSGNGTSGLASSSTVNFNGGTLKASASNTIFLSSGMINNAIVMAGGAIIDTNTFDVTISKGLTHDAGLGGTADGGLTKNSTGKLTLTGSNTYTGNTTVHSGTLALGTGGSFASSPVITVGDSGSSGTVLDLTALSSFTLGSGQTGAGIGTWNIGSGKTITVNGHWAPGNSIGTNTVTGNLTLAGSSDFQLGTTGSSHGSPGLSDRTNVSGTLTLGGALNLIDNSGADGNGSAGAGSYLIFTQSGTATGSFSSVNALGSGAGVLHGKVDTGTSGSTFLDLYRLAAASAHTPEPINFGVVHQGATATQVLTISNSAAADGFSEKLNASLGGATGDATASGSFTLLAAGSADSTSLTAGINTSTGGTKSGTATITLNSDGTGTSGYGTTAIGTQTVNVSGSVFNGNATWTGAGSAWGSGASANWMDSNGINAAPGTFAGFDNVDSATFDGTGTANATVNLGGTSPSLKSVTFNSSTSYTIAGSGDTLTMKSDAGNATITDSNGNHTISTNVTLASDTTVDVVNSGDTLTTMGGINGIKGLVKTGAGTLDVQGVNSYGGATDVNGGTFLANGTLSGTGAITVNNGGTLGGAGFISTANVTLASTGAKLSAGSAAGAIGTLTLTSGNLDISTGINGSSGDLLFDLTSTADLVALDSGTLSIGSGVLGFNDFVFSTSGLFGPGVYTLFATSHDISLTGSLGGSLAGILAGYTATIGFSVDKTDIILTVTAVPEPATYGALAGLALTGLSFTSVIRRRS